MKAQVSTQVVTSESDQELVNCPAIPDNQMFRIYIVWTVGMYLNGVRYLDIRAVTSTLDKAKLYSKMLRRDKEFNHEDWQRVVIEPRVANHLYGAKYREMMINTGQM